MIGYVTIGVSDMEKGKQFYGKVAEALGGQPLIGFDRIQFFGKSMTDSPFAICIPYDQSPCQSGNGNMMALNCESRAKVDDMHQLVLSLGGSCDGAPGERMPGFYGAYARDPDGNKLCFFILG